MGVIVRFPSGLFFTVFIVPFVPVDVYLDRPHAPPLLDGIGESLQVVHRRVFFYDCHAFAKGTATMTDTLFTILVCIFHVLFLHRPAGHLLHQVPLRSIVFLKGFSFHER